MRQSVLRPFAAKTTKDFFGILDITNKDVAGCFSSETKLSQAKIEKKYDPLIRTRRRLINEERKNKVFFGSLRFDGDNVVEKHGQYEAQEKKDVLHDTIKLKQIYVPDGCDKRDTTETLKSVQADDSKTVQNEEPMKSPDSDSSKSNYNPAYKISELKPARDLKEILELFKGGEDHKKVALLYKNKPPLTFFFESIGQKEEEKSRKSEKVDLLLHPSNQGCNIGREEIDETNRGSEKIAGLLRPAHKRDDTKQNGAEKQQADYIRRPQVDLDAVGGPKGAVAPIHELDDLSEEYAERSGEHKLQLDRFDRSIDRKFDVTAQTEEQLKPITAFEHIERLRSGRIEPIAKKLKERMDTTKRLYPLIPAVKLDSRGFRNYTNQVPDWTKVGRVEAIDYIRQSIIYNNYGVIALNKPYGLPAHSSKKSKDEYDINSLMSEVAAQMRIEKVYLAHRLDKTTTGVLLFATSQERANNLNKLFKADEIKKTYWCITKGIPDPEHGIIDMPIGEIQVSGKLRSCPAPVDVDEERQLAKRYRESRRAITEYQVLTTAKNAIALVELKPQSGVKHQLRCHLSFGMNTPILGDHKYSHLTKLAPQKLPPTILKALNLRQTKVRTLPLHLHAKQIVIPGIKANGETLFIGAPLPHHFISNMKSMKLRYEDK